MSSLAYTHQDVLVTIWCDECEWEQDREVVIIEAQVSDDGAFFDWTCPDCSTRHEEEVTSDFYPSPKSYRKLFPNY